MKTYSVQIPVTGSIIVTINAESPEAAIEAAWDKANFEVTCDDPAAEAGEFDTHKQVTRGNVCSALCNKVNVEEV